MTAMPSDSIADEYELAVAFAGRRERSTGHIIQCASCGAWFRTTDWPPAICQTCRVPYGRTERVYDS